MPDTIAKIHLYAIEHGGTANQLSIGFRCPVKFEELDDNRLHDCMIHFEPNKKYSAGESFSVPLTFLCRDEIETVLKKGAKFKLWDTRFIGEGEVLEVFPPES